MVRVVFLGNSQSVFSNRHFQALMQTPCTVAGVIDVPPSRRTSTNPARLAYSSFVEVAHQRAIPTYEPARPNAPEFVATISDLSPDLFVAVGYVYLLKPEMIQVPRILAANFHASLLPAYRGKHPVFWALRQGERWAGLTVHVMDQEFDTGDVLYQTRLRTRQQDTVATLYDRIMDQSVALVPRLVEDAERGKLRPMPQSDEGASYYSSVHEDDFRLDWSREAEELRRWIQTTPGQCFCYIRGRRVFFLDAKVIKEMGKARCGTLLKIGRAGCMVATGSDALFLRRAKLDQGDEQPMPRLCRQLGLETGASLA